MNNLQDLKSYMDYFNSETEALWDFCEDLEQRIVDLETENYKLKAILHQYMTTVDSVIREEYKLWEEEHTNKL